MPFVAEAEAVVSASREVVFDRLAAFGAWASYMPASFRPIGAVDQSATLRTGDSLRMRITGLPARIRVTVMDRPREITWTGGVRGVFHADHHFYFEAVGADKTRIRSVETWSGVVARLVRRVLERTAERVGREQVTAIARAAERGS